MRFEPGGLSRNVMRRRASLRSIAALVRRTLRVVISVFDTLLFALTPQVPISRERNVGNRRPTRFEATEFGDVEALAPRRSPQSEKFVFREFERPKSSMPMRTFDTLLSSLPRLQTASPPNFSNSAVPMASGKGRTPL